MVQKSVVISVGAAATLYLLSYFDLTLDQSMRVRVKEGDAPVVDEYAPYRVPLIIGCMAITLFTVLNGKDSVKLWPHPVFWKAMQGL